MASDIIERWNVGPTRYQ